MFDNGDSNPWNYSINDNEVLEFVSKDKVEGQDEIKIDKAKKRRKRGYNF